LSGRVSVRGIVLRSQFLGMPAVKYSRTTQIDAAAQAIGWAVCP